LSVVVIGRSWAGGVAGAWLTLAGCGADVNLGGAVDAASDAIAGEALPCEPCEVATDCRSGLVCAQFAGDTFCATGCAPGQSPCAVGEVCSSLRSTAGAEVTACAPASDTCAPAPATDGGSTCGQLNGPTVPSECSSCGKYSDDCQRNGCYGGWWCNTATRRCQAPPKTCP
jgi:hypothetical protein